MKATSRMETVDEAITTAMDTVREVRAGKITPVLANAIRGGLSTVNGFLRTERLLMKDMREVRSVPGAKRLTAGTPAKARSR